MIRGLWNKITGRSRKPATQLLSGPVEMQLCVIEWALEYTAKRRGKITILKDKATITNQAGEVTVVPLGTTPNSDLVEGVTKALARRKPKLFPEGAPV